MSKTKKRRCQQSADEAVNKKRKNEETLNAQKNIATPIKNMLPKHKDGKNLKTFLHGIFYQQKMLLLAFLTGETRKEDFGIATEVDEAAKFDDMIFVRRNFNADADDKKSLGFNFFQAKHCIIDKKKITYEDLLAEETDNKKEPYSLLKYFQSIPTIKKNFKNYTMENFIICSNLQLDLPEHYSENKCISKEKLTNLFFDFPGFISYKLKVDDTDEIWSKLLKGSVMHRIANILVEHILLKKRKMRQKLTLNIEILKQSNNHVHLFKYGILTKDGKTAEFNTNFLDGRNDKAKPFYDILENIVANSATLNNLSDLKNEKLTISKSFGQEEPPNCINENDTFFAEIRNDDVKEFFEKLIFLQTPNEDDLAEILNECLRDIDSKLHLMDVDFARTYMDEFIINWMKERSVEYKDKSNTGDLVKEIKQKLAVLQFVGMNSRFCEELKAHNVSFKSDETQKEVKKFLTNEYQVLHLKTKQALLSSIKIYQVLSVNTEFKRRDSFIFDYASLLLQQMDDLTLAVQSKKAIKLLVIVCEDEKESDFEVLKNKLLHIVPKDKKIIFVTKDNNFLEKMSIKSDDYTDEIKTDDLTEESKNVHLNKMVKFQGVSLPMLTLIDNNFNLIDSETLLKLVLNNEIYIGQTIESFCGYDSHFYFPRKFLRDIFLSKWFLFKENFYDDQFILEQYTYPKAFFYGGDEQPPKKILVYFYKEYTDIGTTDYKLVKKKENLHILSQNNGPTNHYKWIKTNGSVSSLVKAGEKLIYRDLQSRNTIKEEALLESCLQEKIIIIADIAGMGKSTILTSLIKKLKECKKNDIWIIRINFNKLKTLLENTENDETEKLIDDMLKEELFELTSTKNLSKNCFNKTLFKHYLKMEKVVIVFDGYDEIDPKYVESVDKMFKALRQKKALLWITTRTQYRDKLEELLGVFSYSFKPFDKEEEQEFLTNFWKINYKNLFTDTKTARLQTYVKSIHDKYLNKKVINIIINSNTALIIKMFAELFQYDGSDWKGCYSFLDREDEDEPELPDNLNLFEVYETFTHNKLNIFVKQKNNNVPKKISKRHQLLAVRVLLNDELLHLLLKEKEIDKLEAYLKDGNNGIYGIIDYIKENKVYFVHLTFAEFYAAKCILKKLETKLEVVFQCINYIWTKSSDAFDNFVCHLMDEEITQLKKSLNGTSMIGYAIEQNLRQFVERLIPWYYPDQNEKNPLHYAAECGNTKIVLYVLSEMYTKYHEYYKCNQETEKPFIHLLNFLLNPDENNTTAKDYAEINNHQDVVDILNALENAISRKYLKDEVERIRNLDIRYIKGIIDKSDKYFGYMKFLAKLFKHANLNVIKIFYDNIDDEKIRKDVFNDGYKTIFDKIYLNPLVNEEDEKLIFLAKNGGIHSNEHDLSSSHENSSFTGITIKAIADDRVDLAIKLLKSDAIENHVFIFEHFINEEDFPALKNVFKIYQEKFPELIGHLFLNFFKNEFDSDIIMDLFTEEVWLTHKYIMRKIPVLLNKVDVNVRNKNGETPLIVACEKSYKYRMLKYLIKCGANVNAADMKGNTPLSAIFRYYFSNLRKVKYLIKKGANVNAVNNDGETPLYKASFVHCDRSIIHVLIKNGADVNAVNFNGETPLFAAIRPALIPSLIIKNLIKHGAFVCAKNNKNQTIFDFAVENDPVFALTTESMPEKINYLLKAGIIYNSEYLIRNKENFHKTLIALLDYINELFHTISNGKDIIAEESIDLRFVVNSKWERYVDGNMIIETLLHCAVRTNNLNAVQWLIENKVNVNAVDTLKDTPKMIAERHHYNDIINCLNDAEDYDGISTDDEYDSEPYGSDDSGL